MPPSSAPPRKSPSKPCYKYLRPLVPPHLSPTMHAIMEWVQEQVAQLQTQPDAPAWAFDMKTVNYRNVSHSIAFEIRYIMSRKNALIYEHGSLTAEQALQNIMMLLAKQAHGTSTLEETGIRLRYQVNETRVSEREQLLTRLLTMKVAIEKIFC